jgi:adenylylsulfate kinase
MSFTLWFMGRPASGKSTLAKRVEGELRERGIAVENLDGDELRQNLHPDLGFTREERAINNRRTAFISKLLNRNEIPTIVAMITPFRDAQQQARDIVSEEGDFVLVYVKCSVETAAERDPKGMYEQAREGKIENFTGVNHPFEEPLNPEVIVDTEANSEAECASEVLAYIDEHVLDGEPDGDYQFDLSRERERSIKNRLDDLGYLE